MSAFSVKNYNVLAALIKAEHGRIDRSYPVDSAAHEAAHVALDNLTDEMVVWFKSDNPRFNRNIFRNACDYQRH